MIADPRFWLSVGVLAMVGGFDLLSYFISTDLPHDLLVVILTTLNNGGFIVVVQWWFGSSHSSQEKDQTIAKLANGKGL